MKQTSYEAYQSIKDGLPELQQKVLAGLQRIKRGSFRDIARAARLRESQVWKRLSELKNRGLIKEDGTKVCSVSGRSLTIWELIE
tara:strand:+ start:915 stop:1169 length:255 start_codon:yes stop_codon:yes gene_type:complete